MDKSGASCITDATKFVGLKPFQQRSFPIVRSLDGLNISLGMRLHENSFFLLLLSSVDLSQERKDGHLFICAFFVCLYSYLNRSYQYDNDLDMIT